MTNHVASQDHTPIATMDAETQRFLADLMGTYRGAVHRWRTIAEERAVLAAQALLLADELTAPAAL